CRLVDDLLDISRITRGKVTLRMEVVDLVLVARRALETTQPLLTLRDHEVLFSPPAEPVWVEADPTRLEQVLANLLNNAAKYTERGGKVWLTVERSTAEGASCGVVRVRDTGIGIAPEMLPRMFDLFTQAERSLERAEGGMGIGLSLVRSLVQMHGGAVSAASPGPGGGSEFTVTLPALAQAPPTSSPTTVATGEASNPGSGAASGRRRVLLVEDNVDAAETLVEMLDTWGHDVRCVHDGRAALLEIGTYRPEVVLLDIGLPGMDGYEVARRLREQDREGAPRMLLIALTGYGQAENRKLALDAGFDLHLTKPVDAPQLRRMLGGPLPGV
ncbi:MAG TPA: ATP-binding protein, partial [Armatimonadota bacterium]|nr:ATP-binding protein [Armatimonadota bacterium]